jgi:HK97 family phage portal protein
MEWNKKLLQNDMRPPGVISAKRIGDIKKFRDQFKEKYQGYENAGVPVALEGDDIKWENISINPKDVDWLNGQKFTIRQICSIFGVDPCLVGDSEFATYSNKQEAQKGLYTETVLPLMDIYRDELNSWLVPLYGDGLYLDYDRDKIEAIQEDRGKK